MNIEMEDSWKSTSVDFKKSWSNENGDSSWCERSKAGMNIGKIN
jgi:hypothetical protein